jgi:L-threonylcarbamoyladenylate synthase
LTLVLPRKPEIAPSVSAGLETVAIRMPANRIALDLIDSAGGPIAAPSANASGKPSPTRAEHVLADLAGRIDLLLDGGETRIGIESTVLDMTADPPSILRPGWITRETLAQIIGPVTEGRSASDLRRSPGTLHRHYRPRARLILIESGRQAILELCRLELKRGKVGLIAHSALEIDSDQFSVFRLRNSPDDYAHWIYSAMRQLDAWGADVIVVEAINERGEGAAVMDRLRRAASETITT